MKLNYIGLIYKQNFYIIYEAQQITYLCSVKALHVHKDTLHIGLYILLD